MDQARIPDDAAPTALAQTSVWAAEATRLRDRGDPVPKETVLRYQQKLELAMRASGDLEEPAWEQTHDQISESVGKQLPVLEPAAAQVSGQVPLTTRVISQMPANP
jgi:hypothetical protein